MNKNGEWKFIFHGAEFEGGNEIIVLLCRTFFSP